VQTADIIVIDQENRSLSIVEWLFDVPPSRCLSTDRRAYSDITGGNRAPALASRDLSIIAAASTDAGGVAWENASCSCSIGDSEATFGLVGLLPVA